MVKTLAIVLGVIILVLLGVLIFWQPAEGPTVPAISPVTPGQVPATISPDGKVSVSLPHPNDVISSPVAIEGQVVGGGWFFEASFPIKVLDGAGTVIGSGQAHALSDWTSTGTVPFSASITFTTPHPGTGTIVFSKDNPSGNPENAGSFSVPVSF